MNVINLPQGLRVSDLPRANHGYAVYLGTTIEKAAERYSAAYGEPGDIYQTPGGMILIRLPDSALKAREVMHVEG